MFSSKPWEKYSALLNPGRSIVLLNPGRSIFILNPRKRIVLYLMLGELYFYTKPYEKYVYFLLIPGRICSSRLNPERSACLLNPDRRTVLLNPGRSIVLCILLRFKYLFRCTCSALEEWVRDIYMRRRRKLKPNSKS